MGYGDWNDRMGGGSGWWILMTVMMVVFWGGIIWFAVTLIRRPNFTSNNVTRKTAHEILDKRLARGEIELDDYRQRLEALRLPKE
jgi:putative membrane protein